MAKITSTGKNNFQKYDVVVIGGGPSGMMAAGRAAELGARVLLVEKNETLGNKLLMTGGGRCNVTQAEFDDKKLVAKIGQKGKFLFSSLSLFGPEDMLEFLAERKVPTKIEADGRVFPVSDKAMDVLRALKNYLQKNKVEISLGTAVLGFEFSEDSDGKRIVGVRLADKIIRAKKFILATGGASYPTTGSTGDGYQWACECGHKIITPMPMLVPIKIQEKWVKEVQGVSLENVKVSLLQRRDAINRVFTDHVLMGDIIFTHFGLSGPAILNLSRNLTELENSQDKFGISIDLKPEMDRKELDALLQKAFIKYANKDIINYLPELLPPKLAKVILRLADIPEEKKINVITKFERTKLVNLLKDLRLTVIGNTGFDQAMVTRGGVDLVEVEPKTMRSKIVTNLYLAGEVLDLDGPTGGYNLQICWSTGYAAGTACVGKNKISLNI
ncbi:MAG: NAD(P)/FAD-dependent oxidoreductase [Parcubacteria group bacterium]